MALDAFLGTPLVEIWGLQGRHFPQPGRTTPAITIAHFGIYARLDEVGCELLYTMEFGEGNDRWGSGEYH